MATSQSTHFRRHYLDLLWFWTLREIKIRYKQSILGVAWAVLQPVAMAAVFTLVFSYIARIPSEDIPYPLFVFCGLVPWTFLATSISQGIPSLVGQMNLVTKAAFPRIILPFGIIGASFLDFIISFLVLLGLLGIYQIPLSQHIAWMPVFILVQVFTVIGVTLAGSAINVYFRDIRFIIPLIVQIWMYLSPVVYPASLVPERFKLLFSLNPMSCVIEGYRSIFLLGLQPDLVLTLAGILTASGILLTGTLVFLKLEPGFADVI